MRPTWILAALLLAAACLPVRADIAFFDTLGDTNYADGLTVNAIQSMVALPFQPGASYVLTSAEVYVRVTDGGESSPFTVGVWSDSGGTPGSALESLPLVFPSTADVATLATATFAGSTTLNAGTPYWLVLTSSHMGGGVWCTANNPGGPFAFWSSGTWNSVDAGNLPPTARIGASTPEPASLLLLSGGLALSLRRRRHKA